MGKSNDRSRRLVQYSSPACLMGEFEDTGCENALRDTLIEASPRSALPLTKTLDLHFVRVFAAAPNGGNPAPVVLNADPLTPEEMRAVAARYGHESAFVCASRDGSSAVRLRFFVPEHEMEMCGHATLGALWLLRRLGRWTSPAVTVETLSGLVDGSYDAHTNSVKVSQPQGTVAPVIDESLRAEIERVLRLQKGELQSRPIVNATTSRTKTLIPLRSVQRLNSLSPMLDDVRMLCDKLASTGLYPFAVDELNRGDIHARQFPRASGYPEDAATGIAAAATLYAALYYELLSEKDDGITVHQGYAMGKPSRIRVQMRDRSRAEAGCWISGAVELMTLEPQVT